jgi:uncharacterized protein (DUF305 family)
MRNLTRRAAVAVIAGAAAVAVPTAAAPAAGAVTAPAFAHRHGCEGQAMVAMAQHFATVLRGLHGPVFEQTFMAEMIPHHAAAVAMARLELARGAHPALKAMARQTIASQEQEIGQMTRWLRAWYGLTPAQAEARAPAAARALMTTMQSGMQAMVSRLSAVPAGPRFDEAFMKDMVAHHEMAIVEAGTVPDRSIHLPLAVMARQIVASQSAEAAQMRAWLRVWYRACPC